MQAVCATTEVIFPHFCLSRQNTLMGVLADGTSRISFNGQQIFQFLGVSAFSQYTVVPETSLTKIRRDAPLDKVFLLCCGVSTGYGAAVKAAEVRRLGLDICQPGNHGCCRFLATSFLSLSHFIKVLGMFGLVSNCFVLTFSTSIYFQCPLNSRLWGSAGASLGCHGCDTLNKSDCLFLEPQKASSHSDTPTIGLKFPVCLTCMFEDCVRQPENPKRSHRNQTHNLFLCEKAAQTYVAFEGTKIKLLMEHAYLLTTTPSLNWVSETKNNTQTIIVSFS